MQKIKKPWGYEIWFAETDKYVGKYIFVEKGNRLSYQYHEVKDETLSVIRGAGIIVIDKTAIPFAEGDAQHIAPYTKHRIEATNTDMGIIEVSTPEVWDVVRLEDDYGREERAKTERDTGNSE